MIVSGPFDPITNHEISWLKLQHHLLQEDVWICVNQESNTDLYTRLKMVELAIKPYRYMHVIAYEAATSIPEDLVLEEEKVREGYFKDGAYGIQTYLIENNLYLDDIVKAMCKPHRAIHSKGVADTCVHLAKVHHLDVSLAYRMGMLHDITKRFSDEEGRKIIALWKPEWLDISPKVWHSYTAVIWLKQNMNLHDEKILHAIAHHTLGDGHGAYDHLLYIADKIEPNRGYDTTKEMKCAEKDLSEAAALIKEESRAYILEKEGVHV